MTRKAWAWDLLAWIGALHLILFLLASADVIDFHICLKAPGHCKIIDPTRQPEDQRGSQ